MVSLAVVENCASALWPDHMHAALAVADGRKGEQIILLSDSPDANRTDLIGWAKNHGVSELAVPRKVFHVPAIPLLGTGKTDYGRAGLLLKERLESEAPPAVAAGAAAGAPKAHTLPVLPVIHISLGTKALPWPASLTKASSG